MSANPGAIAGRASIRALATVVLVGACHRASSPAVAPPPAIAEPQIAPPLPRQPVASVPGAAGPADVASEVRVTVDTHGRETDVRDILGFLGQTAGVNFLFSPQANKKIRITLTDVPLSQAIEAVLSVAGLTLEGTTSTKPPAMPGVVFYQIPVNIDSLSAESIMKAFGVGREVAELLVQARPPKP